jgi:hypothetical protein
LRNFLMSWLLGAVALAFSSVKIPETTQQPGSVTPAATSAPDLSGVWIVRDFLVSINPKEDPPFQPWAQAAYKARLRDLAKSQADPDTPAEHCDTPPGLPRVMLWPLPWEIVQARDRVVMIYEYESLVRQIFTDGRKHPSDLDPTYMGHSIGRYEGDTLVVDTIGFNDKTWLDLAGHLPHTEAFHLVERMRRTAHDTLEIDYTIDDPKAYTKPWIAQKIFKLKPDWEIKEYVCAENNEVK